MRMELVAVSPVSVSSPNHSGAKLGGRKSPSIDGGYGTLTCCPSKTVQRQGECVGVFSFWGVVVVDSKHTLHLLRCGAGCWSALAGAQSFLHPSREACGSGTRLLLLRFELQEIKISLGVWLRD